ncbi:MAG: site-specific DNA-methyltransferase [Fusobacteriaceae bacterium]|jgi:DNA modification methylase|nr:site-specific DNA-methyltransferase [Fusobacteriaceae bacterium]
MNEQMTFEFPERPTIKGFPELRWTGKRPYRSTQYFPAQLRERYGEEQDGWINKIFWGDNLQVMSHLMKEFRGKVDLIYIDPPFDSKAEYKKTITLRGVKAMSDVNAFEEKQYGDIWTNDEYLQFMYERFILMRELLSDKGSIYLHCDWHKSGYLRCICDEVFGIDNFLNEIIWCYTGGTDSSKCFGRKHDVIFFYKKTNSYIFNGAFVPFAETTLKRFNKEDENGRYKENTLADGRVTKTYMKQNGKLCPDYWNFPIVNKTYAESVDYPTQKPEALIERIIKASSNPGDLVFDCFMGSGTTQAVAMKLGRRFIGADINLGAIQTTTKRLISLAAELTSVVVDATLPTLTESRKKGADIYEVPPSRGFMVAEDPDKFRTDDAETDESDDSALYTGFEVYNVNNYEFFRNPIEARDLLIEALGIQPFPQTEIWDGELDGRMVKIMPVNRIATKADSEELIANLPFKLYEKRKSEAPDEPVERITIVCMGHEPDLQIAFSESEVAGYKLDIQIVDILRDKADLQLKREAEADIAIEGDRLVIRAFYPLNLMQKLSLQKEYVEDWRQLVESIMIDWNYDGVMQPSVMDIPGKKEIVNGVYGIPKEAGTVKVKITDLLSESLEVEVKW